MLKNLLRLVALTALLLIPAAQASTVYDQVFASPSTIKCNSDISCSILDHIRVQALTYTGNPGTAVYTWTATCASAPDAVFYIRPTGAVTGCFQMDGFATSGVPLTNALTSAHILVGNASNVATDTAVSGDATISNTGHITVSTIGGVAPLLKTGGTMTGELITAAPATGSAGFNLPQGASPSAPVNGDVWTTSLGIYVRINGATVGPLSSVVIPPTLVKSANYTVASGDISTGSLTLEVNAASGAVTIIVSPSLGTSGSSAHIFIDKTDTTTNPVYISDGSQTVDAIVSPATAAGQINGWRNVYMNGTNLRVSGAG